MALAYKMGLPEQYIEGDLYQKSHQAKAMNDSLMHHYYINMIEERRESLKQISKIIYERIVDHWLDNEDQSRWQDFGDFYKTIFEDMRLRVQRPDAPYRGFGRDLVSDCLCLPLWRYGMSEKPTSKTALLKLL